MVEGYCRLVYIIILRNIENRDFVYEKYLENFIYGPIFLYYYIIKEILTYKKV